MKRWIILGSENINTAIPKLIMSVAKSAQYDASVYILAS